jgi:gamma-glutamylcyclotransferase (GGCT)/AIG2-like uncharacterized protein YtfP
MFARAFSPLILDMNDSTRSDSIVRCRLRLAARTMLTAAGFLIMAVVVGAAIALGCGAVAAAGSGNRLVVYGSLAPGEENHHVVAGLEGTWQPCVITGTIDIHDGYRIFRWEKDGERVHAQMLISRDLPENWRRLDEFEGADYRRVVIPAELEGRLVLASVYTAARNLRTRSEIRSWSIRNVS